MGEKPTVRVNEVVVPAEDIEQMERQVDEMRSKLREIDDQVRTLNNEMRLFGLFERIITPCFKTTQQRSDKEN